MTLFIEPHWPAPACVTALCTTRSGGISEAPYDAFNLALHVGDDPAAVAHNRLQLLDHLTGVESVQWLEQVHSATVVDAGDASVPRADACTSNVTHQACAVLTADCLPVLLCDRTGRRVAAVHAGWRGLAAGIIQRTLERFESPPEDMLAWLGPAIGPAVFEVGPDVRDAFLDGWGRDNEDDTRAAFTPGTGDRLYADLYALARQALAERGVRAVYGGGRCTFTEKESFYSYRRDGPTGRMATLISLI